MGLKADVWLNLDQEVLDCGSCIAEQHEMSTWLVINRNKQLRLDLDVCWQNLTILTWLKEITKTFNCYFGKIFAIRINYPSKLFEVKVDFIVLKFNKMDLKVEDFNEDNSFKNGSSDLL